MSYDVYEMSIAMCRKIECQGTNLIGVNVSKPLTADQGSPFFLISSWRFRAVISTAKAA